MTACCSGGDWGDLNFKGKYVSMELLSASLAWFSSGSAGGRRRGRQETVGSRETGGRRWDVVGRGDIRLSVPGCMEKEEKAIPLLVLMFKEKDHEKEIRK